MNRSENPLKSYLRIHDRDSLASKEFPFDDLAFLNAFYDSLPFLCHHFVDTYLSIDHNLRNPIKNERIEKYLLRKSFESLNLIPSEVLWRKKEAFSDGVSNQEKS